jgi:hypothetical protein
VKITVVLRRNPRPNLSTLLAAYFADGVADYPTVWDAVRAFQSESGEEVVRLALSELRGLIGEAVTEEGLRAAADEMSCDYYPLGDGMSYVEFFTALEKTLSQPLLH